MEADMNSILTSYAKLKSLVNEASDCLNKLKDLTNSQQSSIDPKIPTHINSLSQCLDFTKQEITSKDFLFTSSLMVSGKDKQADSGYGNNAETEELTLLLQPTNVLEKTSSNVKQEINQQLSFDSESDNFYEDMDTQQQQPIASEKKEHFFPKKKSMNKDATEKLFECEECGKRLSSKVLLVVHRGVHQKQYRKQQYKYYTDLKQRSQSIKYVSTVGNKQEKFSCKYCKKSKRCFPSMKFLSCHMKLMHRQQLSSNWFSKYTDASNSSECHICLKRILNSKSHNLHKYVHKKGRNNKCKVCSKSFISRKALNMHKKCHAVTKMFSCQNLQCQKMFSEKAVRNCHMKMKHHKALHRCKFCGKVCSSAKKLTWHKVNTCKYSGNTKPICTFCSKEFSSLGRLLHHMHLHNHSAVNITADSNHFFTHVKLPELIGVYVCSEDGCAKMFKTDSALSRHVSNIHSPSIKRMARQCPTCNKILSTAAAYKNHLALHDPSQKFSCDMCEKKYTTGNGLRRHKELSHSLEGKKPYQCSICKKRFVLQESLERHARLHTGEKPYQCDECGQSYFNEPSLKRHKRFHTGEMIQCPQCDKKFPWKHELKNHMYSHTGERKYICDLCGSAYFQSSHLKDHMQTHKGVYVCQHCSKTFTRSRALKEHLATHTGVGMVACDYCDKSYNRKTHLTIHMKQYHPEKLELYLQNNKGPKVRNTYLGQKEQFQFTEYKTNCEQFVKDEVKEEMPVEEASEVIYMINDPTQSFQLVDVTSGAVLDSTTFDVKPQSNLVYFKVQEEAI